MRSKYMPHSSKREANRHNGSTLNSDFVPKPSGDGMNTDKPSRQVERREHQLQVKRAIAEYKLAKRKEKQTRRKKG